MKRSTTCPALVLVRGMTGMTKVQVQHVDQIVGSNGKVYLYYRNRRGGGKRVKLRGPVGSPEFWEDYLAASSTPVEDERRKGTLRWLVEEYYSSAAFSQLNDRTKYVRRGLLERFCEEHGGKRYAQLETRHVRKIRDRMADTPEQANNTLKALRQVFKHAVAYDLARHNPVVEVEYLRPKNRGGFHAWSVEEVEQFEERHPVGSKARLALALLLYTGQRRSDVISLGRQHERDGWLTLTQQKTGKAMSVPVVAPLRAILDASPTGDMTYLVTQFGKPFTSNGFGNWFRKRCDEAGLPHCSAHGLRKAAGYFMAEAGCTTHEIASVLGHETLKEVERYTKAAGQRRLAEQAGNKLSQKLGSCVPKMKKAE